MSKYTADDIRSADPKRCWIDHVKNVADKHHIVPVEYGGDESGLTVPLCPTCHRNIHREAEHAFKTQEVGKFVNRENYPNSSAYERARLIARYVLQSKQRFVSTGKEKADSARNMAQVSFTSDELARAHDLKRMLGMKSLPRMIKLLIADKWQELKKKGK